MEGVKWTRINSWRSIGPARKNKTTDCSHKPYIVAGLSTCLNSMIPETSPSQSGKALKHIQTHTHTHTHTHAFSGCSAYPATSLIYKSRHQRWLRWLLCVWSLATGVCTVRGTSETHTHTPSPHTHSQNVNNATHCDGIKCHHGRVEYMAE